MSDPGDVDVSDSGLSLVHGWLPAAVQVLAAVAVLVVLARSGRRWWTLWVPVVLVVGVVAALVVRGQADGAGLVADPPPASLWVWTGTAVAALVLAVLGWPRARWWRRAVAVLAVPLAALAGGVVLNQWVGYVPTVQSAWAQASGARLPDQVDENTLDQPATAAVPPPNGAVVALTIPSTASGFVHRTEYVYLPPAWFTAKDRTRLPVVMLVGAEFSVATDWIRTGGAVAAADRYADAHGGLAPVIVMPDASGSFQNDTECVNGPRGRSADHLTGDVRPYVVARFGLSTDPARWAVAGFSTGGTCAADLTVMHPELFGTFVDISGDRAPNAGNKAQTIARLFGGDAAAYDAFDPAAVLARHGRYAHLTARFDEAAGRGGNTPQRAAATELCAGVRRDGGTCMIELRPGGHTWQFAAASFAADLPWLTDELTGTPAPAPVTS